MVLRKTLNGCPISGSIPSDSQTLDGRVIPSKGCSPARIPSCLSLPITFSKASGLLECISFISNFGCSRSNQILTDLLARKSLRALLTISTFCSSTSSTIVRKRITGPALSMSHCVKSPRLNGATILPSIPSSTTHNW